MIYRFGNCTLNVELRELHRDGSLRAIEPQVFDLLCFLIRNRERVVTRNEIVDTIWQGRIISESVLGTRINAVRAAIGDNGKDQRLIRTMRRKGLRFVGAAREEEPTKPALRRAPMMPVLKSPLSSQEMRTVAVLPFRNLSGDPGNDLVTTGLAEEFLTALSRFNWLTTISRHSAFAMVGRAMSARQIADRLGVRYLLDGSLRQSGDRLRVTVRLIDSIADYQIFSDGYDCDLRDIFALQDELVAKVIDAIANRLYAVEVARARLQTHKNLTSWQSILRAIWLINTRQKSQVATAERILRRATTTDPKCATAFALLSFIKTLRVHMGWQSRIEMVPDARRIAKYAISLNTDDPWAHLALGYATLYWRTEEAFELLRQALDCDPNLATAHYLLALASSFTGDSPAAFRHADMADKLKAYDLLAQGNTGAHDNVRATSCFIAGRYHDGMAFARKVIRVNPRQTPAYRQLALNSAFAGELEDAANALGAVRRLSPNIQQWLSESARSWRQREDYQKYLEGFRLAGLPYAAGRIHP